MRSLEDVSVDTIYSYHSRQKRKLIFLESPCCSATLVPVSIYAAMLEECEIVFCCGGGGGVYDMDDGSGEWRGDV